MFLLPDSMERQNVRKVWSDGGVGSKSPKIHDKQAEITPLEVIGSEKCR